MSNAAASRKIVPWRAAVIFALAVFLVGGGTNGPSRVEAGEATGTVLATVVLNTIEVASVSAPANVAVGERFQLVATVANTGTTRIMKANATVHVPGSTTTALAFSWKGNDWKNLGVIQPLSDKSAKWNLVAEEFGCQIIQVTVQGIEQTSGELLEDQGTVVVEVGAGACSAPAVSPETIPSTAPEAKPTPDPSPEPTVPATSTPAATPDPEPTVPATLTPTSTPDPEPTVPAVSTPTAIPGPEPTLPPTSTPAPAPGPEPTIPATSTPIATPSPEPTVPGTATPQPASTPAPTATATL